MKNETKTIVIIPSYNRDEIHSDWKNVLEECNKKEENGFEHYIHQNSNLEKKLILIDGNISEGVKFIGEGIGKRYGSELKIMSVFQGLERGPNEFIKYKFFLKDLACQSKVLVMDGAVYLENKDIESYHSLIEKQFKNKKALNFLEHFCPKTWETLGTEIELYKFPMNQEGVNYTSYTNGGDNSLRPAVRRLENSFDEGFQAIEEYAEDGNEIQEYTNKGNENYKRWAEKWSIKKD